MYGLANMLLFWQSVEELKLLESKGVEDAVRDRITWAIFKAFIADGENNTHVQTSTSMYMYV